MHDLLGKGYFPRELPPPFQTQQFTDCVSSSVPRSFHTKNKSGKFAVHNLARAGTLRRTLGIPNPIHQFRLARAIAHKWKDIETCFDKVTLSLSRPVIDPSGIRAVERLVSLSERPEYRAKARASSRYLLQADISRFYGSIYTHSIPWAAHTKAKAKADHSDKLFGNLIDRLVRNGQDNQTVGIPIGPDTSLIIAELILCAVDEALPKKLRGKAFRYVDDYEFAFHTQGEAEDTLGELQEKLTDFELALNPEKTGIVSLPQPLEAHWAEELRVIPIRKSKQATDLIRYFDLIFDFVRTFPNEHVVHYALQRVRFLDLKEKIWPLFEDLLIQAIMIQPGAIRYAIPILGAHQQCGYKVHKQKLAKMIHAMIDIHARQGHGSEVAWSLWAAILFDVKVNKGTAKKLSRMDDCVIALLALDAQRRGLIDSNIGFSMWRDCMTTDHLYERQWLLAYEANVKGWLPTVGGGDHVALDDNFNHLKTNNVSFYDLNVVAELRKKKSKPEVSIQTAGYIGY